MKILYVGIGVVVLYFFCLKIDNQINFKSCLKEAESRYHQRWKSYCKILEKRDDCELMNAIATEILDKMYEDQESCAKIYK